MMTSFHILPGYFFRLIWNQFLSLAGTRKSKMTFSIFFFRFEFILCLKMQKNDNLNIYMCIHTRILLPLQKSWLLNGPESFTTLFFHTCRCTRPLKIYCGSVDCG